MISQQSKGTLCLAPRQYMPQKHKIFKLRPISPLYWFERNAAFITSDIPYEMCQHYKTTNNTLNHLTYR